MQLHASAAPLERVCDARPAMTDYASPTVVARDGRGLVAVVSRDGAPALQRLDARGRPEGEARPLEGGHRASDAVLAGDLVVTRGDGLRGYARDTGRLRWHVQLPDATTDDGDVLVAHDPRRQELGVVWVREHPVASSDPGRQYGVIRFARLGLDGRWIDAHPTELTRRDPRHGASLGYLPRMDQLRWTGRGYRFAWWQADDADGHRGTLRVGDVTRPGRLAVRVVASERADVFRFADGPTGTALVWTTARDGRTSVRALVPGASRPFTVAASGGAPFVVWHRGAFVAAWDASRPEGSPGGRSVTRLGRLDARRGAVAVREAPLDLSETQWSQTEGVYGTACGLVAHTAEVTATRTRPWLWFAP